MRRAIESAAQALRQDFDASFAEAPSTDRPRVEDFLTLSLGPDPYAVALSDVAGVHRGWRVIPVASHAPELLGIAGSRGSIVPVYDLGALLGYPPERDARWFLTVRSPFIALALARFEGHVRILTAAISGRETTSGSVRATATIAGAARPIVDVASIVANLARRGLTQGPAGES